MSMRQYIGQSINGEVEQSLSSWNAQLVFSLNPTGAGPADVGGYAFMNDSQKKYAYFTFLDSFNAFNENGSPISEEIFHSDFFALPFRLSFEIDRFRNTTRITQKPFNAGQPLSLFIRFKEPTTKTLRVLCFYRCVRRFQLDSARLGYLSHTTDQ